MEEYMSIANNYTTVEKFAAKCMLNIKTRRSRHNTIAEQLEILIYLINVYAFFFFFL